MPRTIALSYGLAALFLVIYIFTLLFRSPGQFWTFWDNWSVDAFEVTLALLCLGRYLYKRAGREVGLAMGLGLLAWSLGDVVFTIESRGGASPPTPSVADAFYLIMYPLAYLAVMLLIRSEIRSFKASIWLDGAVAGLGAAAIVSAFVFDTIIHSLSGSGPAVAVNLAYPIGDLILLACAVGALVIVPGWPVRLITLVAGCLVMAIGDTVYLFESAAGTYKSGTILDASWMTALFLLSLTVWQRVSVRRPGDEAPAPGFVLPAVAAASSVVIIFVGNWVHISGVALGLTVATLVLVGVRASLSRRELRDLTRANHHQAVTDELTGLGNRRMLAHELEALFAAPGRTWEPDETLALLMIDLDHFKEINDSFGHPTGDGLLRQIGPRLASVTRATDIVARLGGDEFAILLTGADVEFATAIAERITSDIEPPFDVGGSSLHVGASIGIALAPQHALSAIELMRCADVAMYRAKAAHSPYDIYESALDNGADRLNLMEDLRNALDNDGLMLHYQPQIDLRSGQITTLEALLRWPHPDLGFIPPDQFIPLAEDSGLMGALTSFVLERAVAQCARWRSDGHDVAVAVNLSTTNLLDSALPEQILETLGRYRVPTEARRSTSDTHWACAWWPKGSSGPITSASWPPPAAMSPRGTSSASRGRRRTSTSPRSTTGPRRCCRCRRTSYRRGYPPSPAETGCSVVAGVRSGLGPGRVDEVAKCDVDVHQVQPPRRAERLADQLPRVAGRDRCAHLEPRRSADGHALPGVELRLGHPRCRQIWSSRTGGATQPAGQCLGGEVRRERRRRVPGQVGRVRAEDLEPGRGRTSREFADPLPRATEQRVGRWRLVETRVRHDTPGLGGRRARRDVSEAAAHRPTGRHRHVAAQDHRGDEQAAGRRNVVDLPLDQVDQDAGPLGVHDQDHAPTVVVVGQVVRPRRLYTEVRLGLGGQRPGAGRQSVHGHLRIHRRIDLADLGEPGGLTLGHRRLRRIDIQVGRHSGLPTDRRVHVEAVNGRVRRHRRVLDRRRTRGGLDSCREVVHAGVGLRPRSTQPLDPRRIGPGGRGTCRHRRPYCRVRHGRRRRRRRGG